METNVAVNPVPKQPSDTLADYVKYFRRVKDANGWSDATAAKIFPGLLEVSSNAVDDLDETVKKSFEAIAKALVPKEECYRESAVQKFFMLQQGDRESVEDFIGRCKSVVQSCFSKFAKASRDQLIRDKFVHGLGDSLRSAVLNQKCEKVEEAVQAALLAESVQKTLHSKKKYDERRNQAVSSTGSKQQNTSRPQTASAPQGYSSFKPRCYECNRVGHLARDCQQSQSSAPSSTTRQLRSNTATVPSDKKKVSSIRHVVSERPVVTGIVNGCRVRLLVDSGASGSVLPRSGFAAESSQPHEFRTATGDGMQIDGSLNTHLKLDGWEGEHTFFVGDVSQPTLGMDFLKHHGVVVDMATGKLLISGFEIADGFATESNGEQKVCDDELVVLALIDAEELIGDQELRAKETKVTFDSEADRRVKEKWPNLFVGLGTAEGIEHQILTGDAAPVCLPSYRVPIHLMDKARTQIQKMKDLGVVERSDSEWCSPVVLVKKPNGEIRVAIDFREVNKIARRDAFPTPRIDECLEELQDSSVYSKLDCNSGYYQVALCEADKHKTAFRFDGELLQFNKLPFGLASGPQTFGRLMRKLFANVPNTVVYFDDIVIHSKSAAEHEKDIDRALKVLQTGGITLNEKKSTFFCSEVEFLGYKVKGREVRPCESKLKAMREFPTPTDAKELKRFMGLAAYYRPLIPDFGVLAAPLFGLANKKKNFSWDAVHAKAFESIKQALMKDVVRYLPDPKRPFIVKTDASGQGIGCLLLQEDDNGQRFVIEYASQKFSDAQRRFPVIEQEASAIIFAVTRWRHFLLGSKWLLETDHRPLVWLQSKKDCHGKLGRWAMRLAEFDFDIRHVAGKNNQDADALSRATVGCIGTNVDALKVQQAQDTALQNAKQKEPDKFCKVKELLYRREPETGRMRLCVPVPEKGKIWTHLHDKLGHVGSTRVLELATQRFYWPKMRDDVKRWAKGCKTCAMRKDFLPTPSPAPMLAHDDASLTLFEKWSIDAMGPYPQTESGSKYLLVMLDQFSKWVDAVPAESIGGEKLIDWISSLCSRYGVPRELVLDRGSDMESSVFAEFCRKMGIKQSFTTAYHHQSNPVERTNRTILNLLRLALDDEKDQKDWDLCVDQILFAYRVTRHESTKVSPFEAVYGLQPRLPVDLTYGSQLASPQGLDELRSRMMRIRQSMRHELARAAVKRTARYNEEHKVQIPALKTGGRVYMKRQHVGKGLNKKLASVWIGPFQLKQQLNDVNWLISGKDGSTKVVHVNLLKSTSDDGDLDVLRGRGRPRLVKST